MKKLIWSLPFLVAILTVTTLWQANAERLDPGQMWIPLGFGVTIAGIFLLLFWLLKWTSPIAPVTAAMFTLSFLLFHEDWISMVIIMAIMVVQAVVFTLRKNLLPAFIHATGILTAVVSFGILISLIMGFITQVSVVNARLENGPRYTPIYGQTNIYFIIPDRMPSPAAMRQSGIDPEEFLHGLVDLGFWLQEDQLSQDPYTPTYPEEVHSTRTMRYLASVLNEGLPVPIDSAYKDVKHLIMYPQIFDDLHQQGYTVTNAAPWFNESSFFPTADHNLRFRDISFIERLFSQELSLAYFNRTLLAGLNFRVLQSESSLFTVESARHNWQAQCLINMAESGQTSQFIMAHLMLPHEPFIYSIARDPKNQYYDQIRYSFGYLLNLAGSIRAADPTAVVIIQSDEGMAWRKPPELNYDLTNTQWNGVFTAWYIPDHGDLSEIRHTEILDYIIKKVKDE